MNALRALWIVVGTLTQAVIACGGASSPEMLVTESEPADVGEARDVDQKPAREPGKYADLRVLGPTSAPAFAPVRLAVTGL